MAELTPFEGMPVTRAGVSIRNAGDGLSEALKVDPVELHQGDRVVIVMEGEVSSVQFQPTDKEDPAGAQIRTHVIKAGTATLVDRDLVAAALDEQSERNLRAKEEAAGIERLPLDEEQAS